jgi:uncharacterized protein (TIGR03084 family)
MVDINVVATDLRDESDRIELIVRQLAPEQWSLPTPAEGWTIAHQIGHLHWTDTMSLLAIDEPGKFRLVREQHDRNPDHFVDDAAKAVAASGAMDLLHRWVNTRDLLATRLPELEPTSAIEWFGPPMRPASMMTARLMETWAHGRDIADTLHITQQPTCALRHIAHLGVRTKDFSFNIRGLTTPAADVYVELTAPDGDLWSWGSPEAPESVSGPAEDFCLLVTQRRHLDDLDLRVKGTTAKTWMTIAQAFAGKPSQGRPPARLGPTPVSRTSPPIP